MLFDWSEQKYEMGGYMACTGENRNAYTDFCEKNWNKKTIHMTKEYNIKINLKETECQGMDWINLGHK